MQHKGGVWMGLSCSCDDFDKSEHENWWEAPYTAKAPATGAACCECGAQIPAGADAQAFDHVEVYEPDAPTPRAPWDVDADEMSDEEFDALEKTWDDFCDRYGWDSDCERFERVSGTDYRCERCADLATALDGAESEGGLGFCLIGPGQLIEAHRDYIEMSGGAEMIWKRGPDGTLHPRRMTRADMTKREVQRRWRRAVAFATYGWKPWLRYTVPGWIGRKTMPHLGYEYRYDRDRMKWRWTPRHSRCFR